MPAPISMDLRRLVEAIPGITLAEVEVELQLTSVATRRCSYQHSSIGESWVAQSGPKTKKRLSLDDG
jgi:hypothetical protein